jgi:hypothetical protein
LSLGRAFAAELRFGRPATVALLAFTVFAFASESPLFRHLLPAAGWAAVAVAFGRTLRAERSLVERLARIVEPTAPDFIGPYCRMVTALHAALFAAIAAWIAGLAIAGDAAAWRSFVGFGAWGLLAVFEAAELLVRKLHFRRYGTNALERLLAWGFPAERTAAGRRSLAHLRRLEEARAAACGGAGSRARAGSSSAEDAIPEHATAPSE